SLVGMIWLFDILICFDGLYQSEIDFSF
ncbi:MAG: hypothetical protein RLZZ224_1718, partial [Verrucomicrobiota bacterium]